jgi:hypothetical protein
VKCAWNNLRRFAKIWISKKCGKWALAYLDEVFDGVFICAAGKLQNIDK